MANPRPTIPAAKLILSAPLTHSDWMLREGVAWGPEGVRHMLDACKACGWSRIYWRALDGGRSLYHSKLMDPQGKWDENNFWDPGTPEDLAFTQRYTQMSPEARVELLRKIERYDYATFDTLAEAVRYGHQIGLEIHAWLSINEDDHGWGLQSRFAKAHPESRWRKRDGAFYRSQQSFAFPEVMSYKLALVREIAENYNVDGILLDWLRTGDIRDNPQTDADGVADHGYEEPLVQGFKARYGVDPHDLPNGDERWVRFRAEPHTQFMRSVRKLVESRKPGIPISVLVAHPWCYRGMQDKIDGNLRGLLLDVRAWAQERLIDAAAPAGYYLPGGDAQNAYRALVEATSPCVAGLRRLRPPKRNYVAREGGSPRSRETEGKIAVWLYEWVPSSVEEIESAVALAHKLGAKQILFWEADYIDGKPNKQELQRAMREHAAM